MLHHEDAADKYKELLAQLEMMKERRVRVASSGKRSFAALAFTDILRRQLCLPQDYPVTLAVHSLCVLPLSILAQEFRGSITDNNGAPNLTPNNTNFGKVTGQDHLPRDVQIGLTLIF